VYLKVKDIVLSDLHNNFPIIPLQIFWNQFIPSSGFWAIVAR